MYSLSLEHNNGISSNVIHGNPFPFRVDIPVFLDKQPAHVGKEEPSVGIVGVSVSVGKLMVDSMVPDPFIDVVLQSHGLAYHQKNP